MDRGAVKTIVDKHLEPLKRRLGVPHWSVFVDYGLRRSDGAFTTRAECTYHVDYDKATISLDPDALDDEEEVLEVLRHELFHLVISPFTVYHNAVRPLSQDDAVKADMAGSVWSHAIEKAVINLERMYLGLTNPEGKMPLKKGKKAIGQNVKEMESHGHPAAQAKAAALREAGVPKKAKAKAKKK